MGNNCILGSNQNKTKYLERKSTYQELVHPKQYQLLTLIYHDLASRISDTALNIENFLLFFHKNGYWGHCLFQLFDADSSKLISQEQFIKGIAKIFKTSQQQKIRLLYTFFSKQKQDTDKGITFKNFLTMLYNYPKEDFKNILNDEDFVYNQLGKHLRSIENNASGGRRLMSLYNTKNKNINGMKFKIDESDSGGSQKLQSKVGTDLIKQMNKKTQGKFTTLQLKVGDHDVEVKTACIHHLVKKLAKSIFRSNNLNTAQSLLKFDQFHKWMSNHKGLYNDYYKGFHNEVWGISEKTELPIYMQKQFEMTSKSRLIFDNKKPKKVNLHLLNSLMIVCEEFNEEKPSMIICLQGMIVKKIFDPSNGKGIQIYHRDGIYPVKSFFFINQELQTKWMEHLKYFKGASITQLYDMGQKIGIGKFSVVYKCIEKGTGEQYAIKVIQSFKLDEQAKNLIAHESSIMSIFQHPLLVRHKQSICTKTHIYIITELVNGKDMFEFVKELKYLCEPEAAYIVQQIIIGVRYLHTLGIVHRDLKPQNVMIQYNQQTKELGRIKIIDFGFANYLSKLRNMNEQQLLAGTPNYIAPQMLRNEQVTEKVDNFAIGSILYFALSGNLPFNGYNITQMFQKTLEGSYSLHDKRWKQVSSHAKDLIQKLLQNDPDQRISLDEALRHEWFKQCPIGAASHSLKQYGNDNKKTAFVF